MQQMSLYELELMVEQMQRFIGAQLQVVTSDDRLVVLELRALQKSFCLIFDLNPKCPVIVCGDPIKIKKKLKPMANFLKSNFVNQRLSRVERLKGYGRVVVFEFLPGYVIEFRAYPRGQNLIAVTPDKQIAWSKPKDLGVVEQETIEKNDQARDILAFYTEWKSRYFGVKGQSANKDVESLFVKKQKKLQKAINKVADDLSAKESSQWRQAGEYIVAHQTLSVPQEFKVYIDSGLSLSENIQQCFQKAKDVKGKIEGTRLRLNQLEKELKELTRAELLKEQNKTSPQVKFVGHVKTRKLTLENNVEVYWGKSAKENVEILRKAKPWFLWFHLKDMPGAHAVLVRNKKQEVSVKEMRQVGEWLCHVTLGEKAKASIGERFELLVAECRYVKPIKGDKLGRVNYANEKVIAFKLSR